MKKGGNFMRAMWGAMFIACVVSCEQPDREADFINTNEHGGFMSRTGNSDEIIEDQKETEIPLLHIRLNGDLSEKEATAKFDRVVAEYMRKSNKPIKGVSTEWYYRIATYTGTQSGNGTDGNVRAGAYFKTNKGILNIQNIILNNPGDDHETGKWDYYLFKASFPGQAVNWVKIIASKIQLQGTDGWFVKEFHTYMVTEDQTIPASGNTNIYTFPNVWLDNTCANCWDSYQKRGGYGKLEF